ncbi:GNAT family N-acetyltransferase [uncultured Leifsonia sp.]|jgi:GNAT superfamily N-acetyltransferase|uniref:GNAT family N-acetyltransferase n=1 Tax=uncultured Leifsonia sp. TaxID=340359 RepID=UPI0025E27A47|nr:GNAT family N-acetyltransferase [uncultured Leifsonia sp.]
MHSADPGLLDRLADRGWPALEAEQQQGWRLRASGGVTNRANSVLASGPVDDVDAAIDRAEAWYAERGLSAVFQLSPASPPALAGALAARGYREHSPTDILIADCHVVAAATRADGPSAARVADAPSPGWLDAWWAVDGRGGGRERGIVARILSGGPALYAWSGDPAAPDAVARLALVGEWGGLYAVATLPQARRRGLARELVGGLAAAAAERGVEGLWLQVLAANAAANALYARLGFRRASGYTYAEQVRLVRPG